MRHAARPCALGRLRLGTAIPDRARTLRTLRRRAGTTTQEANRPRAPGAAPDRTLAAGTARGRRPGSGFSAIELLRDAGRHLCLVSRLRLDAGLYKPAPSRKPGTLGRPPVKGARLPSLKQRLANPATRWRKVSIDGWYGRTERRLSIASGTALWHHPGMRVPIRWVLVRDPSGEKEPQAFLCTDLDADPADILRWFVRRWRVETTFEEARRHLGMETQRQWSDLAILRTTPALLGLFSLVTLWAMQLHAEQRLLPECVRWYSKHTPTFSDALALVRRELWTSPTFAPSQPDRDTPKLPTDVLSRLLLVVCRPP